jgi:hypothetical protein
MDGNPAKMLSIPAGQCFCEGKVAASRDDHFREGGLVVSASIRWTTHGHRSTRPSLLHAADARQSVRRTHRGPHSNYPACRLWRCSTDTLSQTQSLATANRPSGKHGCPSAKTCQKLVCHVQTKPSLIGGCPAGSFGNSTTPACNLGACARVGALSTGEECDVGAVLLCADTHPYSIPTPSHNGPCKTIDQCKVRAFCGSVCFICAAEP